MHRFFFLALCTVCVATAFCPIARAAERLSSRSCAAIAFHPAAPGTTQGEQEAGYYKSRLGRIDVRAVFKNDVPERYYVTLEGSGLVSVHGPLPRLVAACAKAKRLTPPVHPLHDCLGDRLVVLIAHTDRHHYLLLYARYGHIWRFCTAGLA